MANCLHCGYKNDMEEAVKKHMGLKVKIMRERAKLTQEQLAEECGVSWRTISNLERGLVVPDLTMLRSIAQKFNASVDDMLELKSISNKSPARIANELKLYEEIKALNSKTLDFLLDIIPLFRSYFK